MQPNPFAEIQAVRRELERVERAMVARPPNGTPNGSTSTSDTSQTGGVAWELPSLHYERAVPSSNLTLGTSTADMPGASVVVDTGKGGNFLVTAVFDFIVTTAGNGVMVGELVVGGVLQGQVATLHDMGVNTRATVTQTWLVSAGDGITLKLRAYKSNAGGAAYVSAGHSNITAIRLSD